jgi:phosphate-selective porin OprO/OprP
MKKNSKLVFLMLVLCTSNALAQIVDPQNVLIQNVHIADGGAETEAVLVNILIKDNKLEIVSKDPLPDDGSVVILDARDGFLLGNLEVGETPSFIILNQDPRENFEILLDTSFFTVFAIHNGRLFRNNLFAPDVDPAVSQPVVRGWKAYTPPPMALPSSYLDNTKFNKWDTEYVSGIFLAAVVLDRMNWLSQDAGSEQQLGVDLDAFDGGEIRGFRVGAVGTLNFKKPWIYTIFGATNAFDKGFEVERQDSFTLFDYRLDIPVFENINLSIGKQKEPISMERIMSMVQLPMQERSSVSDAMLPSRNFGVVLSGTGENQRWTWAGGVFNDWIDTSADIGDSATQIIGRMTWLPFITEDDSNLLHLGIGLRQTNGKEGVRFLTEPEFNKSPIFVDTDQLDANDGFQVNLEASWRKGPYWVHGEYVSSDVDSPTYGDLEFSGYHVTGSWILSGEIRSYNKKSGILGPIPVARSVKQGGWGAWELGLRFSSLDLTDGPIDGGEMDIVSLGLNWWLSPVFNVNMNYRYIENDLGGINGQSSGILARVLLMLE